MRASEAAANGWTTARPMPPAARLPRAALLRASASCVDDHGSVDAVHVAGVVSEKGRRVVLRPVSGEPIVATQAPPIVRCIPSDPTTDVAGEERLVVPDAELRPLEHRQTAHPAGGVRNNHVTRPRGDDDVPGVA